MKNDNSKLKIRKFFSSLFFLFGIFYLLFTIASSVFAQNTLPLIVYPARQFLELSPGEKTAITANFINQSENPVSGFIRIVDFIVRDNQGTPELIENPEAAPEKYAASSWFKSEYDRVTLPPNEKVSLQAQITVPQNAHPGGRYVAFYFQTQETKFTPENILNYQAGTGISPRLASLIYIKIKGDIKENAFVTKFKTKSFQEYGPIEVETEILNRGDYHITPKGEISLKNPFGKVIQRSLLKEQNIFPDSSRFYKNTLGQKWLIGRYRLALSATYGEKGKTLEAFTEVWIFPWKIALIILLTLIIIILLINHYYQKTIKKEKILEEELEKEREEIEKLKEELRKRHE